MQNRPTADMQCMLCQHTTKLEGFARTFFNHESLLFLVSLGYLHMFCYLHDQLHSTIVRYT